MKTVALNVVEKILSKHLVEGNPATDSEIGIHIDQTLTQDALNARKPAAIAPQSLMPANQSTPRAFQRGKSPAAVPRIFPALLTLRQTSSITLLSSGSSIWLRTPIEPERSQGPTQTQSSPGTCRILSRFFTASMCSIWQITIGHRSDSFT